MDFRLFTQNRSKMNHANHVKFPKWALSSLFWVFLAIIAWSPCVFLGYVWVDANGEKWVIEDGQYIYFWLNLVATFGLIPYVQPLRGLIIFRMIIQPLWYRALWLLLAISIIYSIMNFTSLRFFTILIMLSACSIVAAMAVLSLNNKMQNLAFALFVMPISVSVFGAFCVQVLISVFPEISQALNIGAKTLGEGRYLLLNNEANGFGFDAAVTGLFALIMIDRNGVKIWQILKILCAILGLYMLIKSNSRGAMILFASSIFLYLATFSSFRLNLVKYLALFALLAFGIVYFYSDWLALSLRLSFNLNELSSGRLEVWGIVIALIAEQIYGYGFGSSGEIIDRHLGNIYIGLGFEIGIVGAIALIFLLWTHFLSSLKMTIRQEGERYLLFSFVMVHSLLIWSNFEFEVFRISPTHQFFIFLYAFMILRISQLRDELEGSHT